MIRAFAFVVAVAVGVGGGCAAPPSSVEPGALDAALCEAVPYTAIWQIQGVADRSPFEGRRVTDVRGVVTTLADTRGLQGFFLQAHEPDCSDESSNGIFVATGSPPPRVAPGELVRVDGGQVTELPRAGMSETRIVCDSECEVTRLGHAQIALTPYRPPPSPAAALDYARAREGMWVWVNGAATVVGPTDRGDRSVLLAGRGREPLYPDSPNLGERIFIDGRLRGTRCGTGPLRLRAGDVTAFAPEAGWALQGPLALIDSGYVLLQDEARTCVGIEAPAPAWRPPAVQRAEPSWSLATLNAHNLFDDHDDPTRLDPVPSAEQIARQLEKLTETLCSNEYLGGPDVVALQEIEGERVADALTEAVDSACGISYQAHVSEGPDVRGIQTAFLVKSGTVRLTELRGLQACSPHDWGLNGLDAACPEGEFLLHPREPLELVVDLDGSPVTIINVHLKSRLKSASCAKQDCSDWRGAEIAHLTEHVWTILQEDPERALVVSGDFNANDDELRPLLDAGLTDLGQSFPEQQAAYTYVHEGVRHALDRLLVSPAVFERVSGSYAVHANADYEASLEHQRGALRSSDHDPLLLFVRATRPTTIQTCALRRGGHSAAVGWMLLGWAAWLGIRGIRKVTSRAVTP